jgi:hypothetical protein
MYQDSHELPDSRLFLSFLDFSSQNCFRFARFAENLRNLGLSRPAHYLRNLALLLGISPKD